MAFGPESTNPRERRAYAHALIAKSIESGKPADKLDAVKAGNRASLTKKGKGLGLQAVRAAVKRDSYFPKVYTPDTVTNTKSPKFWTSPEFVERHEAVSVALGGTGISITKPETAEEYLKAAQEIKAGLDSGRHPKQVSIPAEKNAEYSMARDSSVIQADHSVPGTLYESNAVQSLAFDNSRRR